MTSRETAGHVGRVARKLEAVVGLLSAAFVGIGVLSMGLAVLIPNSHRYPPHVGWIIAGSVVAGAAEVLFFLTLVCNLDRVGPGPFAPQVAVRLGRWPAILRPVAAAWWAAHFGLGLLMAYVIEAEMAGVDFGGDGAFGHPGPAAQFAVLVAVGFTLAFAFNLYAMLTLTALGFGRRAVSAVWRWRLVLDVALAIAAAVTAGHR